MTKKILIVLLSLFALTACSAKKAPPVDFGSPTGGPDPAKLMPSYGPNDPVPAAENSKPQTPTSPSTKLQAPNPK